MMWHTFQPDSFGFGFPALVPFFFVFGAIAILLKGYALWHAAKRNDKWWFIALLIINTLGILELVYIVAIVKKYPWDKNGVLHEEPAPKVHHEKHVVHAKPDEEHLVEAD